MKKARYMQLALLSASLVLTTACSDDFLKVENPTGEPLEEYYTTDAHIQEALYAAYDPTHWPDWGFDQYNPLNCDAESMGDDFWIGGATIADQAQWHKLFNFEANANFTLSSLWTVDYTGVKRCNDVLKYLGYQTDVTDAHKKLYEMQARLLRVYYYNNLWHYFGNIPFYLENLSGDYHAPQLPADEVYNNLIKELEEIIASNVLPMKFQKTNDAGQTVDDNTQYGRVTQAVAYMLYAEMVMYQNDNSRFTKALDYMKAIINSGQFALNPDFAAIWDTNGEWCQESIWEINYSTSNSERDWGTPLRTGGTVLPTLISPNGYKDPKAKDDPNFWNGSGWGFLPMKKETYALFSDNDKRRDATCWVIPESEEYTPRYQDTHIWLQKYRPYNRNLPTVGTMELNYENNLRVYRYAETLLNAAELSLRTGGSAEGEAKTWLNAVRTRAGLSAKASVTVDDVLTERHLEFIGEGKRYWDLVRAEGIDGASKVNKASTELVPDAYGYRTNSWTPQKKYIPISQAEIDSDPSIKQNNY